MAQAHDVPREDRTYPGRSNVNINVILRGSTTINNMIL